MATIVVNQVPCVEPSGPQTWGELLGRFDQDLGASGRIVTAVRFDGVEEPAFRDPVIMARTLDEVASVEIDAGTPGDLLARTLADTLTAVDSLVDASRRIGASFRCADVESAVGELGSLAEGFHALISIIRAIALALHVDLQQMEVNKRPVSSMIAEFTDHANALIAAQRSADWVTVADVVEYDIEPALMRWRTIVEDLCRAVAARN